MRIIDTVVLIASADPDHPLHERAMDHLNSICEATGEGYMVPSTTILELDLELKTHRFSPSERELFHKDLCSIIPDRSVLPLTPRIVAIAARIEELGYFDSLIVAFALDLGAEIVSTDGEIRSTEGVRCVW